MIMVIFPAMGKGQTTVVYTGSGLDSTQFFYPSRIPSRNSAVWANPAQNVMTSGIHWAQLRKKHTTSPNVDNCCLNAPSLYRNNANYQNHRSSISYTCWVVTKICIFWYLGIFVWTSICCKYYCVCLWGK